MASRFYGLNKGETEFSVAESSSTTSKDFEAVVDLTKSLVKSEVLQGLGYIRNTIIKGNLPAATALEVVKRWGINRGQTEFDVASAAGAFATLTLQGITLTALTAGIGGNSITLALVDPAGNNQALAVSVVGSAISVSLATGGGGAITTTRALLAAALAANASVIALVSVSGAGATLITAVGATPLAGGGSPVLTRDIYVEIKRSGLLATGDAEAIFDSIENHIIAGNWPPA
jgi:hypothetical protein